MKRFFIAVAIHCSLLLAGMLAVAEPLVEYPRKISFHNIMQDQDIALGEVDAIIQDYQGFIWLGGRNALLRYDGYEFRSIPVANPADISQTSQVNQVLKLVQDLDNNLWVATRSGLFKYDRDREVLLSVNSTEGTPLFPDTIYALALSHDNQLLVGTNQGLSVVDSRKPQVVYVFNQENGLFRNLINEIFVDPTGTVWVGQFEGLVKINLSNKTTNLIIPHPADPTSINDDIWAGSVGAGVYRLNLETQAITRYQHDPDDAYSLVHDRPGQIFIDKQGWIWIGSDGGGISLYDRKNDRFLRFVQEEGKSGSLSSNAVRHIYEDNIGDIWIGTYPSGVNVYDRSTAAMRAYQKETADSPGLQDNNVEAVEVDANGNLWLGAGGITRYNPVDESFTHYRTTGDNPRISSTSVLNGLVDSDGEIRFGSWAQGIHLYDPLEDSFKQVAADSSQTNHTEKSGRKLNDRMIWSISEDKQKMLWIATHSNGLTRFDKTTGLYTFYKFDAADPHSISCPLVWTSFEDSQGRFWVGTAAGLNLMDRDQGSFKHYLPDANNPRSLANGSVLSIAEDQKGRVWFGTDSGLHLYHPETDDFTIYGKKDGFIDQGIRAIVEDPKGNLWLGTNSGLVMFNPDTKMIRNYTRFNGELIGGIATNAAAILPSGEIAFGAHTGLYIFDTTKLILNETAPPVVLTDFRIFTEKVAINDPDKILTKVINQTQSITLDYTKSMVSFGFAALNFRETEKNLYAYKLEGFDNQWREVGNQRTALYTNLPAGKYQFRVKASNNDGVWNEEGRSIQLIILPPPWKSWWAYTFYVATFIGLLLLFVRNQHKKVLVERTISRELEHKVAERTAELQNKNAELEQAYAQLEAISLSDPLTGLNNRRYLQKLMPMDIAKVQREYDTKYAKEVRKQPSPDLTFFILDVDHFKSVNDIYGHNAGDQLLIQISEILTKVCRESDCVIRWGGEEFLVVSRFVDREEAPAMAERIRITIAEHLFKLPDGSDLKKTCSIGFACFPFLQESPDSLSWEQVIDIADHALYIAKKSGRNRSVGLATNNNTHPDQLYQKININLKSLIETQELSVIAQDEKTLVL
jgi:diguanylate cyclase (GGDEF)-like protein